MRARVVALGIGAKVRKEEVSLDRLRACAFVPPCPSIFCSGQRRSLYCHQKGRLEGLGGYLGQGSLQRKVGVGEEEALLRLLGGSGSGKTTCF